jgi:hypothetical protein
VGFHSHFGPPSPFFATLTVSSSSSRVTFFIHSRPWGLFSRVPYFHCSVARPSGWLFTMSLVRRKSEDFLLPNVGVGTYARFSRRRLSAASATFLPSSGPHTRSFL